MQFIIELLKNIDIMSNVYIILFVANFIYKNCYNLVLKDSEKNLVMLGAEKKALQFAYITAFITIFPTKWLYELLSK